MSVKPRMVRLVAAVTAGKDSVRARAIGRMAETFGGLDELSEAFAFDHTGYYQNEMGGGLTKRLASFHTLVSPGSLPLIKLAFRDLENEFKLDGKRRVNLDPGLLSYDSLVLASLKYAPHRICLAEGVFAELTLIYHSGRFRKLPWTYPDYASPRVLEWLTLARGRYQWQLDREQKQGETN